MNKSDIRKKMLYARDNCSNHFLQACGSKIAHIVIGLQEFKNAKTIMIYIPFHNEVDTFRIIEEAWRFGKRVIVPVMDEASDTFSLSYLKDFDLVVGSFGLMEPRNKIIVDDDSRIDLVLIPGLGFDMAGGRIGYGKGCYDKFLHKLEDKSFVALAYGFQIIDDADKCEHDISVSKIVTESGVIDCGKII